jgi:hypothetical protein
MFYKIYNVFDFKEYFCNGLVLFLSYDHWKEILSTIDDIWNFSYFLVPYRRKPKRTIVLGAVCPSVRPSICPSVRLSVRPSVRHIKILSCPDFCLTPLIYCLDIWHGAISRWVTVQVQISFRLNDFWLSYGLWTCIFCSKLK